ncbi:MAG: O-antigen ligase family protein [Acidobacteriota bacterium]|nr:O-antigen ligase family protein [Acidobacteriota bacterium]
MPGKGLTPSGGYVNRVHLRAGLYGLFGILCAFTLMTWDGDELAPRILSGLLFLLTAAFLCWPAHQKINVALPALCLFLATGYGIVQTLFFPQKILSYGWTGVLFWFAAAVIVSVAMQIFKVPRLASDFRLFFIVFGTAVCLLDLLQQASQTNKYFWLIASRYHSISGSFAYWNNFAQFVELLLPVTLWRGLSARKPGVQYLLCAAIQIGAVVASGSRAGTILVILELLVLIVLAYGQNRNRALLLGAAMAIGLTVVFVYAAGFETVIAKLQQSDQLTVRRNIDKSSLAMIKARPLTGWGLDTYVPVYRMFALYDDGTYVNRAHNDWLQWAAEGGLIFFAIMLVMVAWSIRPAIHSGWGIGLIAICIHALVDYPFARLGVCGWYFALLGMLAATRLKRPGQDFASGRRWSLPS